MSYYYALIEKDDDSCYGVRFPQLETVFSAGDDVEDAAQNAVEALRLYFEDNPLDRPEPEKLEIVCSREGVSAALAKGGVMIAIPYIEMEGRTVRANLTLDAGLLNAIDTEAQKQGISRSAFVASAARAMLSV